MWRHQHHPGRLTTVVDRLTAAPPNRDDAVMTKPRLSIEEHRQLGMRLTAIRDELLHLNSQLDRAYPRTGPEAEPARRLDKARQAVDEARCELDHAYFREHPRQMDTTTYYPHSEDRAYRA